jgi:hypothetical protein
MTSIKWIQGDTVPLTVTLPVDLTDVSNVELVFMNQDHEELFRDSATITDAAGGNVAFDWNSEQVDRHGVYKLEWKLTWTDGAIETFPKEGPTQMHIRR